MIGDYEFWHRRDADEYFAVRLGFDELPEAVSVPLDGNDVERFPPVYYDVYTQRDLEGPLGMGYLLEVLADMREDGASYERLRGKTKA